jgi:hypothetical protein
LWRTRRLDEATNSTLDLQPATTSRSVLPLPHSIWPNALPEWLLD